MTELLAPVRDEVSLSAAIEAGADAVYFGIGELNMRINSKGITLRQLPKIIAKAHRSGVKVYVTLNTVVYDHELGLLDHLLAKIKQSAADAVICWDFAVVQRARELNIPIHISTQASVSNRSAVKFYENLGAERIVLARELTLEQIRQIKQNTRLAVEVFAHGAMCVSVSGRCFMSQFLSCRSANRGDCLQPCRREYRVVDTQTDQELDISNGYVMSPKDLCTLPILDQLLATRVDVLKIEGRSRPPEYIKTVVGVYRRAIDAVADGTYGKKLVDQLLAEVATVYHRGFSQGFLFGRPGPQDWTESHGSQATRRKEYVGTVLNYFRKPQIAHVHLTRPLNAGDVIQIHGPTTGVAELSVDQLKTDSEGFLQTVQSGEATFPCQTFLRRNDQVYKIIERG